MDVMEGSGPAVPAGGILWLRRVLGADGVVMSDAQAALLARYAELLLAHNRTVNLISRKDEDAVWRNHILHSLAVLAVHPLPSDASYIDVGTGGGLPGIPLAIMLPEAHFVLVDSIAKKIRAVADMIDALGLTNASAVTGRVDELARARRLPVRVDAALARAVAPLDELVRWVKPAFAEGEPHTLITWKGGDLSQEIAVARRRKGVAAIVEIPIRLSADGVLEAEGKKLVRVTFNK